MQKILVPCDFSQPAINAYRLALDIAQQSKGTIHLVNVVDLPVLHDSIIAPVLNFEQQLLKDLKQKSEAKFGKIISQYNRTGCKVVESVLFGSVHAMLTAYIKEHEIDMIVMGSHGASGFKEFFIGSNAERIVRTSTVPVLIVKDYYKGPIKSIVFPNTLETENQEELVRKVKELQNFFKAHLHLVWINTPLNFTSDTLTRDRLNTFAKRFMLKDYTINVFNHPDEEDGILQFAKTIKGDLIAMGTNSRKGIAHVVNGSLAEDVVNHTDKLVWTYSLKNQPVEA